MNCSSDQECYGKNQKCHKHFCGTKKCKSKHDCKDVGHLVSGINGAKKCKNAVWKKGHTLARTDLLCMLNWGTQWTMVSYLKK